MNGAERVYGVLIIWWHIISNPSRLWYMEEMKYISKACCILHNVIMEQRSSLKG